MVRIVLHEPCSFDKGGAHALSSARSKMLLHNLCVPTKRRKDPKQADPITAAMGKRLRAAREQKGWTQAQLSEKTGWRQSDADNGKATGISPSAVGNYEQGTRRFSLEEAEVFASVFELPSAYFLVVVDEHEAEVILAIRKRSSGAPDLSRPARRPTRS